MTKSRSVLLPSSSKKDNQQELQRLKAYSDAARESSNTPNIISDDVTYANQLAQAAEESYNRLRNANVHNMNEARQYVLNTQQYANSASNAFNRLYHGVFI